MTPLISRHTSSHYFSLDECHWQDIREKTSDIGQALQHAMRQGKEYRTLKLYGQERNLITSAIARMNLFIHGIEDFYVERGDTLAEPKFIENDRLQHFAVVLVNPPYSIKQWNRSAWESDAYGRNLYGVPPQGRADYAFFQHIITSMHPDTGRCAILFPHGVLFRDEETRASIHLNMICVPSYPSYRVDCRDTFSSDLAKRRFKQIFND